MDKYKLQSVDNALMIVDMISEEGTELGISEISRRTNLGKSTVHRLLSTLGSRGYVIQNSDTGKYKLGIKFVNIAAGILNNQNIIKECRPYLEELSFITGETIHLSFYNNGEITFVDKIKGKNPSVMGSVIGSVKSAYTTSMGKVFLAYLSEQALHDYLENVVLRPYTPYTITNIEELKENIEKVRAQGYGEDQQEAEEGLVCIAAPIFDRGGEVISAISVSGAASRINENKAHIVEQVKKYAAICSKSFGGTFNSNRKKL
ncbi:IclR family transcriptional regulator [Fusibacter ferrireducens]|uniref:IclR family transcriptional regulator n=1 Tax=Fusibacter ferrireducens TaxID=2785058 RepID=A0ABR9ZPF2_9FIRM|nr:IclR family transcriptional regulator [Fusibacter ferrireducens]MBF4692196.1 IclR family transcriptional regulator [Fusibacter ferrireducens]